MSKQKTLNSQIISRLLDKYKGAECELKFSSNFELLVAVILSAQCTDKRVNSVTSELFKEYNTPQKMAGLSQQELEKKIYTCGFYRNKAKNIILASKDIVARFGGEVPKTKSELKSLAGVGEKTANVVLSTAFKTPAIAVDTHVFRVSRRLGLSSGANVSAVQSDLEKVIKKQDWSDMHYALVLFGRYICKSRSPQCATCPLADLCKSKDSLQCSE